MCSFNGNYRKPKWRNVYHLIYCDCLGKKVDHVEYVKACACEVCTCGEKNSLLSKKDKEYKCIFCGSVRTKDSEILR